MKKLKLAKTKVTDANQPKILNFFKKNVCDTANKKQHEGNNCDSIEKTDEAKFSQIRSPGNTLCSKCLIQINKSVGPCNNCNLSQRENKQPERLFVKDKQITKIDLEETSLKLKPHKENYVLVSDSAASPDIIPPTPPVATKRKRNRSLDSKLVKRKFSFSESNTVTEKTVQPDKNSDVTRINSQLNVVVDQGKVSLGSIALKDKYNSNNRNNAFKLTTQRDQTNNEGQLENDKTSQLKKCKSSLANKNRDVDGKKEVIPVIENVNSINENICKETSAPYLINNVEENIGKNICHKINDLQTDLTISGITLKGISTQKESTSSLKRVNPFTKLKPQSNQMKNEGIVAINNINTLSTKKCESSLSKNNHVLHGENKDTSVIEQVKSVNKNVPIEEYDVCLEETDREKVRVKPSEKMYDEISHSHDNLTNKELSLNNDDDFGDLNLLDNLCFDEVMFREDTVSSVNLEKGVRCEVKSVEYIQSCREMVLGLQPTATCVLRGSWANVVVRPGDTVNVSARPVVGQPGCWVVDDDGGLLVIQPDTLVSGTAVVGSLFCQRRAVLSDTYRGMDSDSQIMVLGSFLHELLQEVLKKNVTSVKEITNVLEAFILSKQFIFSMYSAEMSMEKTKETLLEFVPKIHAFLQKYMTSNGLRKKCDSNWNDKESWAGRITDVADIEENIWASRLGVKGKVDVTVKTTCANNIKVMPLELKTGRASFSAEHRGQVILYTMMMTELGAPVDSGLLLYLREGVMKEVTVGPAERRDLILLRNQLVVQLQASREVTMNDGQLTVPPLPTPIHHHACGKCPYLTLCSAALRMTPNGVDSLSEGHPLRQLSVSGTQHVTEAHMKYVFHWSGLLRLEHTDCQLRSAPLHDIWTLPPRDRMKRGTCLAFLKLVGSVTEVTSGSYEHVFEWEGEVMCNVAEGDYLIVSSDDRPAVAAGPVRLLAPQQITLCLERDLSSRKAEKIWHLDKYESQSGLAFNMTNLGCLLDDSEQAGRLRSAVIDLELPKFKAKLSSRVLKNSVDLLASLNDQQRRAIFCALSAEHYILIKGMPGTGKTATIVALVRLAVRLGLSVVITSHTHSAVDNVLLRLKDHVDFLRLGASHKLHPQLAAFGEAGHSFPSPEHLRDFYNSKRVVGVTCLGASHPLLARRQFDLCIVDEATQVLQPTVLRPLFSAHKFVLIGDPEQLPPLVRSLKAKELGLGQSLFARLDRPAVTSELSQQYRMNSRLTQLANTLTYAGKLQCASDTVAQATLQLPRPLGDVPSWVNQALNPSLELSVVFLETGVTEAKNCANLVEAEIVTHLLTALKSAGVADERVGIMAPYRAQVELLRQRCSSVEVNTVDQYQGRDKDIILYSCTRTAAPTETDILGDKNRLTVAVTRARRKLIFIGNITLLKGYKLFHTVIDSLTNNCIISVS